MRRRQERWSSGTVVVRRVVRCVCVCVVCVMRSGVGRDLDGIKWRLGAGCELGRVKRNGRDASRWLWMWLGRMR
jgi:hypothetical protein